MYNQVDIKRVFKPFDSLSSKLIDPYINALDSLSSPMRSAVIDKLMISIAAPPNPIKMATK